MWIEAALAAVAFAVLCLVVLSVPAQVAEPDDGAYHNSIVAITLGDFLTLSRPQLEAVAAKVERPGPEPMGGGGRRPLHEREGPRLPVPRGAVRGARHSPVGAAVLRGAGLPRPVRRRPALARPLRRRRGRRAVLLVGGGDRLRLARLHADLHGRLADRGRLGPPALGGPRDRGLGEAAALGGRSPGSSLWRWRPWFATPTS